VYNANDSTSEIKNIHFKISISSRRSAKWRWLLAPLPCQLFGKYVCGGGFSFTCCCDTAFENMKNSLLMLAYTRAKVRLILRTEKKQVTDGVKVR